MSKFILIEYPEYWHMKKKKIFDLKDVVKILELLKQDVDTLFVRQWEQ